MFFPYPARRFCMLLLVLTSFGCRLYSQAFTTYVAGLPTQEVFDLLVDKKGFLWVGHDMGVSRFDGLSFTHFAHPSRSSLSATDLVEDSLGRIWFHNFTGQVFFIENERVQLLNAYENEEDYFPRMVLFQNEILVTSNKGLFVCDTRNLKSRYLRVEGRKSSTQSLAIVHNQVVAYHLGQWYLYDSANGFRTARMVPPAVVLPEDRNFSLQKDSKNDTAFLIANPSGAIYQLSIEKNKIRVLGSQKVSGFINSVQVHGGSLHVHGKEESYESRGGKLQATISGRNISDMVVDKQGNTWYSSLSNGLLVEPAKNNISKVKIDDFNADDRVLLLTKSADNILVGTKNGFFAEINPSNLKTIWKHKTHADFGSVNLIFPIDKEQIFVSNSIGTFLYEKSKQKLISLYALTSKSVAIHQNRLFISSATGLYVFPFPSLNVHLIKERVLSLEELNQLWQGYSKGKSKVDPYIFYWFKQRSRSVAITQNKELFISFMNGVFLFNENGVAPLLYKSKRVYSNSLVASGKKIYISTLNNGLIIKKGSSVKRIGVENGLFSNSIVKIKADQQYLWIMQDRGTQLLNMKTDQIVHNFELPEVNGANVYDVISWKDTALLATSEGLYKIALRPSKRYTSLNSMLRLVVINQKDSLTTTSAQLKYFQNDIQFHLAVPWYSASNSLYFKYRLKGASNDSQWFVTQPGERFVRFASLMPGNYIFESYAVVAGFQEDHPAVFQFSIAKPWWQSNLFYMFVILLAGAAFYGIYLMRLRQIMRVEQVRRSISSDLHDEIGSTISSINIYSELAKSEQHNDVYLKLIQENTRDVISKLDDLVWSINPKNDSMHQLLARMQAFAEPVLTGAGIAPDFSVEDEVFKQDLNLEKKRNLYLSFKELVNNVVKHSGAQKCFIEMNMQGNRLVLTVVDDGIGIDSSANTKNRSGMHNLKERARATGATITVAGAPHKGTKAVLSVPVK